MVWVGAHPHWAYTTVFIGALGESLAVVGLVIPGATIMVAAGALVALGAMGFWPTALLGVVGAVAGDGFSFWVGRRYRDRLRGLWPFSRHPQWLSRGEEFFHVHGGKSVVLGRFVGPVRAFVPIVAGMLGMRPAAFYPMNILAGVAWAPAHLLPGMAFGASLALAGVVATRLAALLLLLVALTWFAVWTVRGVFRVLSPRAAAMAQSLLAWGNQHPVVSRLTRGLLDPSRPAPRTLAALAALFLGAAWLFFGVLEDVVTGDPLVRVDHGFHQLAQGLRTPWGDRVMVFLTELGDGFVITIVAAAVLAWLLWRRRWRAAGYWAAAVAFGQITATMIKLVVQRPRPFAELYDGFAAFAFPSGHATMSMVVYGFLAVLLAGTLSWAHRWIAYALATLLIVAVALSRLYLGAHWLSDILGGLSLGLAWVCLLGIAYYRHPSPGPLPKSVAVVALLALVLAGGWHVASRYSTDLQRYAPHFVVRHMDAAAWWQEDWKSLPAYRQDLEGELEDPLNVQWSGTIDGLHARLKARGWREPVPLSAETALRWLLPDSGLADLPMLPHVHDGRDESLLMLGPSGSKPSGDQSRAREPQFVLRLWRTGIVLEPGAVPLWVGAMSIQRARHILFLTVPVASHEYDVPLTLLTESQPAADRRLVTRSPQTIRAGYDWNGSVLLMREGVP
ncbi:MAG: phosphatase PAP2 family protein [Arenicellales bacterium]